MTETPVSCPAAETLAELADGRLPASQRAPVLAHVARCPDCHAVLAEAAEFADEGRRPSAAPLVFRRSALRRMLPAVAALTAAAAAAAVIALMPSDRAPVGGAPALSSPVPLPPLAPAWATGAAWQPDATRRLAFAPRRDKASFAVGRHLGALDRACRGPDPEAAFVRDAVSQSLRDRVTPEWLRRAASPSGCAGGRLVVPDPAGTDPRWVTLGRVLERWRIAAAERDPTGVTSGDRDILGRVGREVPLEPAAIGALDRLLAQPVPLDDRAWNAFASSVADLLEVIDA